MKNKTHMIISKDTSIQKNLAFICDENFQWTRNRKQILHFEKGCLLIGLPRRLSGKESASAGDAGDTGDAALILGQKHPLEEEMATHSSTLAWKIPWIEQPGGLQFMKEVERGGHDWVTEHAYTHLPKVH